MFRKDKLIMIPSRTIHMDSSVWSTGAGGMHPLNEFWAERFLVHSDEPGSGPAMQSGVVVEKKNVMAKMDQREGGGNFSMSGVAGSWIPYGGGQMLCPGRHFAKQEILLSVAMISFMFDIVVLESEGKKVEEDMEFYGLGTLPPKGKIQCRFRRRAGGRDLSRTGIAADFSAE